MASKTTLDKSTRVDLVNIVHQGEKLIIPEAMTIPQVIKALERKQEEENEAVAINTVIDGYFVFDGLYAFHKAIAKKFGWSSMKPTPGFFGPTPPVMLGVQISVDETIQLPWGSIALPGIEGRLETGFEMKEGRVCFKIAGLIKKKHQGIIDDLVVLTREFLKTESIYKGKAFRLRFKDDKGDDLPLPEPKFLDTRPTDISKLVFSDSVMQQIETNLFAPIKKTEAFRRNGIPLKRGVLLAGGYGNGKSMAAVCAAKLCEEHGWTYIAVDRADELAAVLRFSHLYGPVMVFCEDIDRVMAGERSITSDEMLNLVDGIESKNAELMVVFTTNEIQDIQQALLRPGRLDAVISVLPPDAKAAIKLVRQYGGALISPDEDLTSVGILLDGKNAAAIREVVERSKAYAVSLMEENAELTITAEALKATAKGMEEHMRLLAPVQEDKRSAVEKAASIQAESRLEQTRMLLEQVKTTGRLPQSPVALWDDGDAIEVTAAPSRNHLAKSVR